MPPEARLTEQSKEYAGRCRTCPAQSPIFGRRCPTGNGRGRALAVARGVLADRPGLLGRSRSAHRSRGADPPRPIARTEPTPIASTRLERRRAPQGSTRPSANVVKASVRSRRGRPRPACGSPWTARDPRAGGCGIAGSRPRDPKWRSRTRPRPEARFTVPAEAIVELGFVLVVGNASGVDAKDLGRSRSRTPNATPTTLALKADAGDDQIGQGRSQGGSQRGPERAQKGKIRYRWLQAGGPKVALKAVETADGHVRPDGRPGRPISSPWWSRRPAGVMSEASTVTVNVGGTVPGRVRRARRWPSTNWPGSRSPRSRGAPAMPTTSPGRSTPWPTGSVAFRTFAEIDRRDDQTPRRGGPSREGRAGPSGSSNCSPP